MTDRHSVYRNMDALLPHETVNHQVEYIRGAVHTQTIKDYWISLLWS